MAKVFSKSVRSVEDFILYKRCNTPRTQRKLTSFEKQMQKKSIVKYPIVELTQKEFDELPKSGSFGIDWLRNEAPFDFKFICKPSELVPDVVVMGHLVKGMEAICEQYGAGLCVPKKFINRYSVKIIP